MAKHALLKVKNWEQFQHYKDRNPPWIKLHFALLASEDWVTLDDASKLLAVVCMLIASRNNGMVPNNPAYLKRVAYLDRLPKLKPLIECGFLEMPQADDSTTQAPAIVAQADARPETETETDKKELLSETSSDGTPVSKKREAYPEQFEAFWADYPRSPNMSKSKALAAWKKLTQAERIACHQGLFCRYNECLPNGVRFRVIVEQLEAKARGFRGGGAALDRPFQCQQFQRFVGISDHVVSSPALKFDRHRFERGRPQHVEHDAIPHAVHPTKRITFGLVPAAGGVAA